MVTVAYIVWLRNRLICSIINFNLQNMAVHRTNSTELSAERFYLITVPAYTAYVRNIRIHTEYVTVA